MNANPILKTLGFSDTDRVVVIHADDVGMCQTTIDSFSDLHEVGIVSSGSIMVPCPAFENAAMWAVEHPSADLGVHLTLTSEWESYRWKPTTVQKINSGLIDKDGFFHRSCEPLLELAPPDQVYFELQTQIDLAKQSGMDISHIDSHMFSCMADPFFQIYVQLGQENAITNYLNRGGWKRVDPDRKNSDKIKELEKLGWPLFDHLVINSLGQFTEDWLEYTKDKIDHLKSGLTYYLIHPAKATEEMKHIATDYRARNADYEVFMNERLKKYIADSGVYIISYKEINRAKKQLSL